MASDSRVTIHMAASLDGFIARKDGGVDWLETSDHFADGETLELGFEEEYRRVLFRQSDGARERAPAARLSLRLVRRRGRGFRRMPSPRPGRRGLLFHPADLDRRWNLVLRAARPRRRAPSRRGQGLPEWRGGIALRSEAGRRSSMSAQYKPEGWTTVSPYLIVEIGRRAPPPCTSTSGTSMRRTERRLLREPSRCRSRRSETIRIGEVG